MAGFWDAATNALPQGMSIGLNQIAEMQRRKELQDEIRRQQQAQAFMQMMQQQRFNQDQQQIDQSQQNYIQDRQDRNYNNQVDDAYRDTQFRTGLEQQLLENNLAKQRLNQDPNLTAAERDMSWFNSLTPEEQDAARRVKFGLQPKAVTQKPTSPIDRLKYGTDFAQKRMDADYMNTISPNAFDSLRNVGMNEYDSTMNAANQTNQTNQVTSGSAQQQSYLNWLSPADNEAINALQGIDPNEVDWQATISQNPGLNWQEIMKFLGVQ